MGVFIKTLLLFLVLFALREYLTYKRKLFFKYLFTPLVTLSIILFVILSIDYHGLDRYKVLILLSLIFSLIADTIMMIEEADLIMFGIIFFMLAHILYVVAFSTGYSFKLWNLIPALLLLFIMRKVFILVKPEAGSLLIPILVYMAVISVMVFFAVSGLNNGFSRSAILVVIGAVAFMVSDLILAYNAFIQKIPHSSVIVWAVYAPAQLLIAFSCF